MISLALSLEPSRLAPPAWTSARAKPRLEIIPVSPVRVLAGDCLEVLKTLADNSIDAVVTDPPYELNFMNRGWDATGVANNPTLWSEVLRVLKPGGHCVAFSGTRTYHRMACAIEDAGFEVRDQLAWCYGTGFPKSHDVSRGIDKAAGAEREIVGQRDRYLDGRVRNNLGATGGEFLGLANGVADITAPATAAARQWDGWGTALKPAWEPICLARKPLSEKTVAANVLRWGTGAINVDATRIPTDDNLNGDGYSGEGQFKTGQNGIYGNFDRLTSAEFKQPLGRFPANLCHNGSQEVLDLFPETGAPKAARTAKRGGSSWHGQDGFGSPDKVGTWPADTGGSAARFFYAAKASKHDRAGSKHPTVKPVKLLQWLVRLITPPGGIVLDPFAGSGTTGAATILEGFQAILIEREDEYVADIRRRLHGMK